MITHVVLFRMAEDADPAELVRRLRALPGQIPEIHQFEAGTDVVHGPNSFDVGLVSTFDGVEELDVYRRHPAHQEVVAWLTDHTSERVAVDFESPQTAAG